MARIWRASASLMTSGGSRRMTLSIVTLISRPASIACSTRSPQGRSSSTPIIRPWPRISTTPGCPPSERRKRRRAGERVAAAGRAVRSRLKHLRRRPAREAGPDRDPGGEALGEQQDVGTNSGVLIDEPLAGAAEAALDFVDHQEPSLAVADLPQVPQVLHR